jgi:hypothetical protein
MTPGGVAKKNQAPPSAEPDLRKLVTTAWPQRPKNNHNKMITGIGTPNSQSKIPRPIIVSISSSDGFKNATPEVRFRAG